MDTRPDARDFLFDDENFKRGNDCPCCDQFVKRYDRLIYDTMARSLMNLYQLNEKKQAYYHIRKFVVGGDFSKMKYWGLVVEKTNDDDTKRTSGYWAITEKGKSFVRGEISIEKYIQLYNGKLIGHAGGYVKFADAFNNEFLYNELMGDYLKTKGETQTTIW